MNERQQELMIELYSTLKKICVEYQNDALFKEEIDELYIFDENVIDAYNTLTLWELDNKK